LVEDNEEVMEKKEASEDYWKNLAKKLKKKLKAAIDDKKDLQREF
jgi:hypothetical protein